MSRPDDARGLRSSQLVGVNGPGAIVDIGDESFVVCDLDEWWREETAFATVEVNCLKPYLNGRELRRALPSESASTQSRRNPGVRLHRFPSWLFCQVCRRMHR